MLVRVLPGISQETVSLLSFQTEASNLYADQMGNFYLLSQKGFSKYTDSSHPRATYSNIRFGAPGYADVTNPLRLLLFYPEFNTLVFLDRYLTELQDPVSLDQLGLPRAGPVCSSTSGGFWVYDKQSRRLIGYSEKLEVIARSPEIGSLVSESSTPVYLSEKNNRLYLNMPGNGILLFDRYGAYIKTIPVSPDQEFQVAGNRIVFRKGTQLLTYHTETFETDTLFRAKKETVYSMWFERNQLYLLFPGEVQVLAPPRYINQFPNK